MPDSAAAPAAPEARPSGTLSAAISNAVVGLLHNYTGRGPTRARTTIGADTIVVTLRDSLTKAERTLADHGQSLEVLAMRRAFQGAMRDDLVAAVERPHRPHGRGVPQRQPARRPTSPSRSSCCIPSTATATACRRTSTASYSPPE